MKFITFFFIFIIHFSLSAQGCLFIIVDKVICFEINSYLLIELYRELFHQITEHYACLYKVACCFLSLRRALTVTSKTLLCIQISLIYLLDSALSFNYGDKLSQLYFGPMEGTSEMVFVILYDIHLLSIFIFLKYVAKKRIVCLPFFFKLVY